MEHFLQLESCGVVIWAELLLSCVSSNSGYPHSSPLHDAGAGHGAGPPGGAPPPRHLHAAHPAPRHAKRWVVELETNLRDVWRFTIDNNKELIVIMKVQTYQSKDRFQRQSWVISHICAGMSKCVRGWCLPKDYQKLESPSEAAGDPVHVDINVEILDILSINDKEFSISMSMYFR